MEMTTYTYKANKAIDFLKGIVNLNVKEFEKVRKLSSIEKDNIIALSLSRSLAALCNRKFEGLDFRFDGRNINVAKKVAIEIYGKQEILSWRLDPNSTNIEMLQNALDSILKKNVVGVKKSKNGYRVICRNASFSYTVGRDFFEEEIDYNQFREIKRIDQMWVVIYQNGTIQKLPFKWIQKIIADNVVKAEVDKDKKIIVYRANGTFYVLPHNVIKKQDYQFIVNNLKGTATYEYSVEPKVEKTDIKVPILKIIDPELHNNGFISWKLEKNEELSDEILEDYVTEEQKDGFLKYSIKTFIPEKEEFVLDELRERTLKMWIEMLPNKLPKYEILLADFSEILRKSKLIDIEKSSLICLYRIYRSADEHYPLFEKLNKEEKGKVLFKAYKDAIKYGKGDIYNLSKYSFLVFYKLGLHKEVKLHGNRYNWIKDHFDDYTKDPIKLKYAEYMYKGNGGTTLRRGLKAFDLWEVLFERGNVVYDAEEEIAE